METLGPVAPRVPYISATPNVGVGPPPSRHLNPNKEDSVVSTINNLTKAMKFVGNTAFGIIAGIGVNALVFNEKLSHTPSLRGALVIAIAAALSVQNDLAYSGFNFAKRGD